METVPPNLSEWDAREYAELLARETTEWREKRRIAEDIETAADTLADLFIECNAAADNNGALSITAAQNIHILLQTVAAHPNIRPETLTELLDFAVLSSNNPFAFSLLPAAVCRNPVVPFLMLENPDFWQNVDGKACEGILARGDVPSSVVSLLTHYEAYEIAPTARLHVSQADCLHTPREGARELTQFWQAFCAATSGFIVTEWMRQEHSKLARFGVAPTWASGKNVNAPSPFRPPKMRAVIWLVEQRIITTEYSRFVNFAVYVQIPCDLASLRSWGVSLGWTHRLIAALRLPLSDTPFPNDPYNRAPRLLLQHLARDGNRFVRWAAQTRLADPDFVFTWQE